MTHFSSTTMEFSPGDPLQPDEWVNGEYEIGDVCVRLYQEIITTTATNSFYRKQNVALCYQYFLQTQNTELRTFFSCVVCKNSMIVDDGDNGRLLDCGCIAHPVCINGFTKCPQCEIETKHYEANNINDYAHHVDMILASQIVKTWNRTKDPEKRIKMLEELIHERREDSKESSLDPEIAPVQHFMNETEDIEEIYKFALSRCKSEKEKLGKLASTVIGKCLQNMSQLPRLKKNIVRKRSSGWEIEPTGEYTGESTPKKANVTSEDTPIGTNDPSLPKRSMYKNENVMMTRFDGRCRKCKRKTISGRTMVVPNENFHCVMCVFKETTKAIYDFIMSKQEKPEADVSNIFT